jgi:hypothetical protein
MEWYGRIWDSWDGMRCFGMACDGTRWCEMVWDGMVYSRIV